MLGDSTQQSYGSALDVNILPKLGRFAVRELTTNQVQVWHYAIPFPHRRQPGHGHPLGHADPGDRGLGDAP